MLKFSPALQTQLAAATSKVSWCNILVNALGSNLKIRCKRSPDATSTSVFDTGSEFFVASITANTKISAGAIVNFGKIVNATVRIAADLTSGASVVRIEGATEWMEATLGLTTSAADFKVSQNPTAKTGLAFSSISIGAPKDLPSGNGSAAPVLNSDAPAFIELEDWNDPQNPKSVKIIPIDVRKEDFVYQDAEMATEIGDVRVTQSSQTIVYGQFEFGVTMFSINGNLNLDVPGVPVHQIVIAHKPYGTWPSYPFSDTFRAARDTTFPKPYKIKVRNANNVVLKTFEMRDGLPVNSPDLAQTWGATQPKPLRPHMHCGQWHFWQTAKLKYSSNALKYFPGVISDFMRPSVAKLGPSTNGAVPLARVAAQQDSFLQWHAMPEWPLQFNNAYASSPGIDQYDTFDDPYLYDINTWHGDEGKGARVCGWNVEPGSISAHDWFIGPGGVRHDRAGLNTPLVKYFTDPTGARLKGNIPYRTLLDCYNHGYFHHAHHMACTDVQNLSPLPKEFVLSGQISFGHAYYNQSAVGFVNGGLARHVDLMGIPNQGGWMTPTRDGHIGFWNGWEVDTEHSYIAPGLATIFCNSPAHTVSNTMRFHTHILAQLGAGAPSSGMLANWMTRIHAWRMWQLAVAWKICVNHPMGIDRETMEKRFQGELEAIYDLIYKPAIIDNRQELDYQSIRIFGQRADVTYGNSQNGLSGKKWITTHSNYKTCYFAAVFALMRQTGSWAAMRARSTKCDVALRFLLECMDKDTTMSMYYTKGRYETNGRISEFVPSNGSGPADTLANLPDPVLYTSWDEWVAMNPPTGLETVLRNVDGSGTATKLGGGTTLRFQWVYVRRDFFPEIPHPKDSNGNSIVDGACTIVREGLDALAVTVQNRPTKISMTNNDMAYAWPCQGIYKAPATLGPF